MFHHHIYLRKHSPAILISWDFKTNDECSVTDNNKCTHTIQYKHTQTSVCATVHEHIHTSSGRAFVMSFPWYEFKWIIAALCVPLYMLCLLWLLEGNLFLFPPSSKCKWPRFWQHCFPHSPRTSKSREERKDVVLVCMFVLSEPVGLCVPPPEQQPLSQTASLWQSHPFRLAALRTWPQRQAAAGYRAPTEGPIVSISVLSLVNPGRSPSSLRVR